MKLRYLWLWYFPLLFLPNLGYGGSTAHGSLQLSDFLIWPYLVLIFFALSPGRELNIRWITPLLGAFVLWAVVSTLTIPDRYSYVSYAGDTFGLFGAGSEQITFGLLKIAKLVVYGLAGVLTARALTDEQARDAFDWSLLAAGVVTGISLFTLGSSSGRTPADAALTYSATNGISAMMAILLCYLTGRYLTGHGSARWRLVACFGFVVMAAGFLLSDGRGGWVAAIAGAAYLFIRLGFSRQLLTYGVAALIVIGYLYNAHPDFKQQVDKTLYEPTSQSDYQGTRNIGTIDDGGRFQNWASEASKLSNAPILGTGFFHRGGLSGLWSSGSHNFFIQMFLETGVVGGLLVIAIVVTMWRQATRSTRGDPNMDIAPKAALIAAIVGGLSGEYFYGGIILFTLFAVYAPTGGLARSDARPVLTIAQLDRQTPDQLTARSPNDGRAITLHHQESSADSW